MEDLYMDYIRALKLTVQPG